MRQLVNRVKHYFRLYRCLFRQSFKAVVVYRTNAVLMGIAPIVWLATMIIFVGVIFSRVKEIGGWNYWQVMLLLGVHEIIFILTWVTFVRNLRELNDKVRRGALDQVLLKPVNSRFLVSFASFSFEDVASLVGSLFLFVYSLARLSPVIDWPQIFGFLVLMLLAYGICYLLNFILATFSLFWIDSTLFIEWLAESTDFARYPAEIYPASIKVALTFFVPVLFFAYFPTAFLLGKVSGVFLFYGLLAFLVFAYLSRLFWRFALKRYASASS